MMAACATRSAARWTSGVPPRRLGQLVFVLSVVLLLAGQGANALKYGFKDNDPICFIEEVHHLTPFISGSYVRDNNSRYDSIQLTLTLYDMEDNVIGNTQDVKIGEHSFSFSLKGAQEGSYKVCAAVATPNFVGYESNLLFVSFNVDASAVPTKLNDELKKEDLQPRRKVNNMEVFVFRDYGGNQMSVLMPSWMLQVWDTMLTQSLHLATKIKSNGIVMQDREDAMRSTSESTFTRVWVCASLVVTAIVVTVWGEYRYLKKLLIRRKMV